jgi:hypothetical protein
MRRLLVTANVPSSPFVTLMMEALRSSETSVLIRATRRNIPEDGILHSHRRETPNRTLRVLPEILCRVFRNDGTIIPTAVILFLFVIF